MSPVGSIARKAFPIGLAAAGFVAGPEVIDGARLSRMDRTAAASLCASVR